MDTQNHSGTGHNISAQAVYLETISKITSDLTEVVNILGKRLFLNDGMDEKDIKDSFDPEAKILHNNVVRFKMVLDGYKIYVGKLSTIYREFDNQGTNKTHTVLENIKLSYIKEKARLIAENPGINEIDVIRNNADNIIELVEAHLLSEIKASSNLQISSESINLSLQIVLIDAFIRCKILEEPPKDVAA